MSLLCRSSGTRQSLASQGDADGVDGADGSPSRGFDDGADVGVELGSPLAAKAVCDLAIDRAGTERPLGAVVRGFEFAVSHEDEEAASDRLDCLLQFSSGPVRRFDRACDHRSNPDARRDYAGRTSTD